MIFWLIILLNSTFSNDLRVGNDFYQLPNYSENSYREVFALKIDNSFDYNLDYFILKTYFQIYEPIGFDSLDDKSYGLRKRTLQATQFQFDMKLNFLQLSVGRILNFEGNDLYNIDGFRSKLYFKNFSISFLYGKEINTDSFLGKVDFYDEDREIIDYYINSTSISTFYKDNLLMLTYTEYKDDQYMAYQTLKLSLNIDIWNFKSNTTINYLFTRDDFEQILTNIEYNGFGAEYEEYKPFFLNDSIFNIFVIDKYRRSSVYYNDLFNMGLLSEVEVSFFTENFEYYGIKTSIKLLKKYSISSEYLREEHFYLSLNSNFDKLNISLNYFHEEDLNSYATRFTYDYKLILESNIRLYTDLIYNNYYKFQLKGGFLLSSYF